MDLKQLKDFPPNFLWGAGISSFQAEGDWRKMDKEDQLLNIQEKKKILQILKLVLISTIITKKILN